MKLDIAIEIGGANTSIYRKDSGLCLKEPTLVAATKAAEGYVIKAIGKEAKKMLGKTDESVEIFSPISNGQINNFEYATFMLKYFLEKVEAKKIKNLGALVLIPCGLTAEDKEKYIELCYSVGIKEVRLIPAVICACIGEGKNIDSTNATLILDVGGSTTDVAVINLNSIIKGATFCLGGRAMDVAIAHTVANNEGIIIGLTTAEKLKEDIGSLYENDIANMEITGIDVENKAPKTSIISAVDLRVAIEPFFDEMIKIIETTVNLCPPDVTSDIVKNGLFVVGGVGKLAGLSKYLEKELKLTVKVSDRADIVAILGAGKLLSDKEMLQSILNEI